MLDKPRLGDDAIAACLRDAYGLTAAGLDFLPLGNDSNTWVYRVDAADGTPYFLKIKRGPIFEPSVAVPRYLRDAGNEHVVAPLPTRAGALWSAVEDFVAILYPFIDGRSGWDADLT